MNRISKYIYKVKYIKAIRLAAGESGLANGVRAIKRFEMVNNLKFNPFDIDHVDLVRNCGSHERFFRKAKKILNCKAK